MRFQRASEWAHAFHNCFQAQMYLLIGCQKSKRSFKINLESLLHTAMPSDWLTQTCPVMACRSELAHGTILSCLPRRPHQQCTSQILQQLPKTSVVWAHNKTACSPWRRLLWSSYSRIVFSYQPMEFLKVASTFNFQKGTTPPSLLTTCSKPPALHSIHLLWTLTRIYRFYRETLCKKSAISKSLQ